MVPYIPVLLKCEVVHSRELPKTHLASNHKNVSHNYLDVLEVDFYHANFVRFFSKLHSANICKLSQQGNNVEFGIHNLADAVLGSHQEGNARFSIL